MSDLSRSEFCKLTRLSSDALASMARRNQLPFSINQKLTGRKYSVFESFLTIVAQDFCVRERIDITRAAAIAGGLPSALEPNWALVVLSAEKILEGRAEAVAHIMCGWVSPYDSTRPFAIAGTEAELCRVLSGMSHSSTRVSATLSMALLIRRCQRHSVEIPADFWETPFSYRPRPNEFDVAKASMERLLAEGVHLEDQPE